MKSATKSPKAPMNTSDGVWKRNAKFTDTDCPDCGWPLCWKKETLIKRKKDQTKEEIE